MIKNTIKGLKFSWLYVGMALFVLVCTYQRFNVETAEILAREGKKADVSVFVYLSAQPFTTLLLKK